MIYMDQGDLGTIEMDGKTHPIKAWEVWFMTMRGLHTTLPDALLHASATDMPPELIRPVTVAVAEGGVYEAVHK